MPETGSQNPRDFETAQAAAPKAATAAPTAAPAVKPEPEPASPKTTEPEATRAPAPVIPVSPAPAQAAVVLPPMAPVVVVDRPSSFGPQWAGPGRVANPVVLVASGLAGVAAAAALPWDRPGVGWFITAAAVAAGTVAAAWSSNAERAPDRGDPAVRPTGAERPSYRPGPLVRAAWASAALALVAVGALRAASWLFVLCVLAALVCGSLAVAGGRSARGLFLGAVAVPIATLRGLPWTARGLRSVRGRAGGSAVRTAASVIVGIALLLIFGALLAGADAAFATVLKDVLPTVDVGVVGRWLFSFVVVALATLGTCFLAIAPPAFDGALTERRPLRRLEWAMPVGGLVVLFATFVGVQATVLFGGGEHVLRTAGLTYAEYARSGFWQLLVVTALTLVVLAVAARKAARETLADRIWLRVVLGALAGLTLVIVASALSRMWAYERAYGFTQLRLLVSVCEVWLGVVFILVLAAGIRLRGHAMWLPRAVVGTAVVALLGIAAVNPDRFIAEQNLVRYEETKNIDLDYLSTLSADAVPVLDRLPEPLRTCVLEEIAADLDSRGPDDWREWNLGRMQARNILGDYKTPGLTLSDSCYTLRMSTRS